MDWATWVIGCLAPRCKAENHVVYCYEKEGNKTISHGFTIVGGAVFHDNFHRLTEFFTGRVHSLAYIFPQRLQVHGTRDDLVIVLHDLGVDRCVEGIRLQTERKGAW